MSEQTFDWRLPVYTAITAVLLVLIVETTSWFDFAEILYFFLIAPIVAIILLIRILLRNRLSRLAVFSSYCLFTLLMLKCASFCRTYEHWLISGHGYRRAVLAQAEPVDGDFKHVLWDGSGFAGSDTFAYLVFDPSDTLSRKVRESKDGKLNQYLCGAWRVNRLWARWYSITFYTNEGWSGCT